MRNAPPTFRLPAALLSQGYSLRPETEKDMPFLKSLFASTRESEMVMVRQAGWSAEQERMFLEQQFTAQRFHFRTHFIDCAFDVIEANGVPAGRLYIEPRGANLQLVDIALMPEWRGNGVGTMIVEALIETARSRSMGVGIFVEKFNPALRLYQRLGFTEIRDTGVYFEMELPATSSGS